MRRLTVVSVAYPLAPVGLDAVGGAEQVLSAIDNALVCAGHRSIVVAVEGSTASGELVTYPSPDEAPQVDEAIVFGQRARAYSTMLRVISRTGVDIVHMHGIDFHHYLPPSGPPTLATLHLPLAWYPEQALLPARPSTWLNCVSGNQAAGVDVNPCMLPPINNGVPVEELGALRLTKRGYLLMLARVCPEKGQHLALEAAHATNALLLIAGEVFPYPTHQQYFEMQIRPLLDHKRRYIGPLGFARKRRLLAGAACLLIPSVAPETSSLAAMEAASCGTPVIAFRVGALPELVEDGRTGFIVDYVDDMTAAIRRIGEIDPETCRAVARERFAVDRMTDAYIARYGELTRSAATSAA